MRRALVLLPLILLATMLPATAAWAGSPHFIKSSITAVRDGDSLTVSGKEAGLGDEPQVHIVVTATAQCINPGGNHPKAGNKEDFSAEGDFPVQNGKAEFSLTVIADFDPDCSPPMSVVFTNVTITDETSGITTSLPGTF
jgi:hypothetical protein